MEFDVVKRIQFLREQKGYTVNKLANLSGISQSFLRDIELHKKKPTVDTLAEICFALDVSLRDFFDDDTAHSLSADPLMKEIYRMTPEQRKALAKFLKTI